MILMIDTVWNQIGSQSLLSVFCEYLQSDLTSTVLSHEYFVLYEDNRSQWLRALILRISSICFLLQYKLMWQKHASYELA